MLSNNVPTTFTESDFPTFLIQSRLKLNECSMHSLMGDRATSLNDFFTAPTKD